MARGKGEGSIYFDKKKKLWTCAVELPPGPTGERRRKVVSSKKKPAVVDKLRKLHRELETRGDIATKSITIQGWIDKWLVEIAPNRINPNQVKKYASTLNTHVGQRWGKKRLDYLTTVRIRDLISEVSKSKSPSTARDLHSKFSSCLRDAVNDGYLPRHPMEHLEAPRRAQKQENALSVEDTIKLLKYLAAQMDSSGKWAWIAPLYIGYLLTGARRGELAGLRPEYVGETLDVQWQLQRLDPETVERASADYEYERLSGNFYLTRPKYESTRTYPLVEPLKSVMMAAAKGAPEGSLMFTRQDGQPLDPDSIGSYYWPRLLIDAGIEEKAVYDDDDRQIGGTLPKDRVKLHGTRHGLVDILYELEIPEHIIVEVVGHSDRKVTRKYRTRQSPAVKAALEDVSKRLEALDSTEPAGEIEPA